MQQDINLALFDRLRNVERMLRTGRSKAGDCTAASDGSSSGGREEIAPAPPRHLRREFVLVHLRFHEHGLRQREVAEEIRVSPSTFSETIARLEEEGYVERIDAPDDRRSKLLRLTEKGNHRAEDILDAIRAEFGRLFQRLSPEEKDELIRLLDKMLGTEGGTYEKK